MFDEMRNAEDIRSLSDVPGYFARVDKGSVVMLQQIKSQPLRPHLFRYDHLNIQYTDRRNPYESIVAIVVVANQGVTIERVCLDPSKFEKPYYHELRVFNYGTRPKKRPRRPLGVAPNFLFVPEWGDIQEFEYSVFKRSRFRASTDKESILENCVDNYDLDGASLERLYLFLNS